MKCCFCIEIKIGTLICAYFNLIAAVLFIIFNSLMYVVTEQIKEEFLKENTKVRPETDKALTAVLVITALILIVNMTFAIILVVGLHKNKRGHVKAYLIFTTICIILIIIDLIASGVRSHKMQLIMDILMTVVQLYFVVVVRRYYLIMDTSYNGQIIYKACALGAPPRADQHYGCRGQPEAMPYTAPNAVYPDFKHHQKY